MTVADSILVSSTSVMVKLLSIVTGVEPSLNTTVEPASDITGASLTRLTSILVVAVFELYVPSLTTTLIVLVVLSGLLDALSKVIASMTLI